MRERVIGENRAGNGSSALVLTESDHRRLSSLLSSELARAAEPQAKALSSSLARATVVPNVAVAPDVVTMNSRVAYCDHWGRPTECTVVYPWDADPKRGNVSVLAPLGIALLGARVGATIVWTDPDGEEHEWTVLNVLFQPEAEGLTFR
jgi:regulator of nucleoside diphosphate kinase